MSETLCKRCGANIYSEIRSSKLLGGTFHRSCYALHLSQSEFIPMERGSDEEEIPPRDEKRPRGRSRVPPPDLDELPKPTNTANRKIKWN